jgi:hypothetical protein
MIAIAVLGLVVSLVGTVVGWQLVGDLDRGVGQSLELTGEVLVTVDESFTIAEDALEILTAGVDEAESAVRSLSRSLEEGEDALASVTALTGDEIDDFIFGRHSARRARHAELQVDLDRRRIDRFERDISRVRSHRIRIKMTVLHADDRLVIRELFGLCHNYVGPWVVVVCADNNFLIVRVVHVVVEVSDKLTVLNG